MDFHQYYMGQEFDCHQYFGAHQNEEEGYTFRTFAPNASKISLIGDFNNWKEQDMGRLNDRAFFELSVSEAKPGDRYKYRIYKHDGSYMDHNDPYGRQTELRPQNASIVVADEEYPFQDQAWMEARKDKAGLFKNEPLNIYEIHAGSWRQHEDGSWYSYRELADELIPYVKENGYNWIEMMPISEHPFDGSWGYQSTGFFSPTSRYGTPEDLKYFVDQCHENGIGVLLDFVPVHFAVDDFALANYDGTPLYEYPNQAVGKNEWGSCNFMHSRGEVRSFLNSSANYWLDEFHFDGLRLDAVSNLIYWQGDSRRGVNGMTIGFLQNFNKGLKERHPGSLSIAEDSSAYKGVTGPADQGGLGFDMKWDLGWMNDTLAFFRTPFEQRKDNYHKLTFGMVYFYDENFLLPLSHDEVVHGKGTIVNKMYGSEQEKLQQARALYLYMLSHPGKKLNFMGNELAQLREWNEAKGQDWNLMEDADHKAFHDFIRDLNKVYEGTPALYQKDYDKDGFEWIQADDPDHLVYAYIRKGDEGTKDVLCIFNFSDQDLSGYELKLKGVYADQMIKEARALLSSDWPQYGGKSEPFAEEFVIEPDGFKVNLPALSGKLLEIETTEKPEEQKAAKSEKEPAADESAPTADEKEKQPVTQ